MMSGTNTLRYARSINKHHPSFDFESPTMSKRSSDEDKQNAPPNGGDGLNMLNSHGTQHVHYNAHQPSRSREAAGSASIGRARGMLSLGTFAFEPAASSTDEENTTNKTTTTTTTPQPAVAGRRGTKVRSLDLGIGLSWAPTKLREDALIPSGFRREMEHERLKRAGAGLA